MHIGAHSIGHRARDPHFYKWLGTGGTVCSKTANQTVLTITKALTKTTNCTCKAKKVEEHDKKNSCALRRRHCLRIRLVEMIFRIALTVIWSSLKIRISCTILNRTITNTWFVIFCVNTLTVPDAKNRHVVSNVSHKYYWKISGCAKIYRVLQTTYLKHPISLHRDTWAGLGESQCGVSCASTYLRKFEVIARHGWSDFAELRWEMASPSVRPDWVRWVVIDWKKIMSACYYTKPVMRRLCRRRPVGRVITDLVLLASSLSVG